MKAEEIARRLEPLTVAEVERGINMVRGGYGAYGMTLEHTVTLKQANALHALVGSADNNACVHYYMPYTQASKRCPACGALNFNRPEPA